MSNKIGLVGIFLLDMNQAGFRKGHSTIDTVFMLHIGVFQT